MRAEDVNDGRPMMRVRAAVLLVAAIALLGSAFISCEPFCCVFEGETEVHAAMPCCTTPAAISRPEVMREAVAPASVVPSSDALSILAAEPVTAARVTTARAIDTTRERERHRTSPPLFLTNAQLLI